MAEFTEIYRLQVHGPSLSTLLDAYQQLAESIPLLSQYIYLFKGNSQMIHVLALFYEDILEFHRVALRVFSKPSNPSTLRRHMVTYISAWKKIFRATWKDFDSKFRHIIDGLGRHKTLVEGQATILQFEKQQMEHAKTETSFTAIQDSILSIQKYQREHLSHKKQFEAIEKEDNKRQRLALLDWLAATDPILDHETAVAMRADYSSSGNWILKECKTKGWLDPQQSTTPLLWINGIPGAGGATNLLYLRFVD